MLRVSIGIDTSNYKTSVGAVTEKGDILCNLQQYLNVRKGERGLRQSVALFQHINNLPELIDAAFAAIRAWPSPLEISGISVSSRPRSVEGSYMPCFQAGLSSAKSLAAALDVPCFTFSHQEGHIEAVRFRSALEDSRRFLSFHFSGGTTEALLATERENLLKTEIVGGTKDIAFGQVLDRIGVAAGMNFPCGEEMDRIASDLGPTAEKDNLLPRIKCENGYINLSGIETKAQRLLETMMRDEKRRALTAMVFTRIGQAVSDMCRQLSSRYDTKEILLAGGVSASSFIRMYLQEQLTEHVLCFGDPALSTDNAVGIALLGGKKLWR